MVKIIAGKIGVDGAVGFSLMAKIVQASAGLISIVLISLFLSQEAQGYYYTFSSIIALQVFFELGLNTIITQYVAHESVHLKWESESKLTGKQEHLSRLSSLLHFCLKLFSVLAVILFGVLYLSGYFFFSKYHNGPENVSWQLPWLLVSITTALMLLINPILAFFEGLGKVKEVAKIRLMQQSLNLAVISIVLVLKGGLYALGIASLASFSILLGSILFTYRKHLFIYIYHVKGFYSVNYWKEIFPYQYKIALSWISGYFIFQLFNPVLFATEGAVVAGQMGMTLQALNGISALSMTWINTKVPLLCSLIAKKEYNYLDKSFNILLRQVASANLLLVLVFISFVSFLTWYNYPLAHRFLPIIPLTLLCLVMFVNQFIFSWATYLRCHKQEPFLINSIVIGILCTLSTTILGEYKGLMGIVTGYTLLILLIAMPWSYAIFVNKKASWHRL